MPEFYTIIARKIFFHFWEGTPAPSSCHTPMESVSDAMDDAVSRQQLMTEDNERCYDEEEREDTETESVDDCRHKLPLTTEFLLLFHVLAHLSLNFLHTHCVICKYAKVIYPRSTFTYNISR